jgi:hypothetical protein
MNTMRTNPWRVIRRAAAVPVLPVGDVGKAIWYYQRFFGFSPVLSGEPDQGAALVRGHGVTIQLRLADQASCHDQPDHRTGPDATVLVAQPGRMRRKLDDLGAHLIGPAEFGPEWQHFFGFRDCYGNRVAVGPVGGALAAARRQATRPADALALILHRRRTARLERHHMNEFRAFYESLEQKRDIYYMLFTSGLLHWVGKAISYVPGNVNLVLLGSDLPDDELSWVRDHIDRPFHHIRLRLDQSAAWEFLFAVNRHNFGWIDCGCFVLDPRLFGELALIDRRTSLNCTWSWDSGLGFPIASTHLLFVNAEAIAEVRKMGLPASPAVCSYGLLNRQVEGRRCYARTPSHAEVQQLRRVLPSGSSGLPVAPGNMPYFDMMVMYQLLARTCGFGLSRIRGLKSLGHVQGRPVEDESSDELFYLGGLGDADVLEEFSGYFHDQGVRLLYLIAEHVTLTGAADSLPERYRHRLEQIRAELAGYGLTGPDVELAARRHLTQAAGMSAAGAAAVLGGPDGPGGPAAQAR